MAAGCRARSGHPLLPITIRTRPAGSVSVGWDCTQQGQLALGWLLILPLVLGPAAHRHLPVSLFPAWWHAGIEDPHSSFSFSPFIIDVVPCFTLLG